MAGYCTFCPFSRWRAFCCTAPEASVGHHDAHGDKRYLRRSPHLARARPGHSARHGAFHSRRRLGGQGGGRSAHGGVAGRSCRAPFEAAALDGVWKGGSRADGAGGTSGGDGAVGRASASGGAGNGGGASGGVHAYAASCGMAACFAALFFAPLGSTAFVIELSRYDRSVWRHAPFMLLACFVAFGLASIIGIGDVIPKVPLPALSWPVVGQCVVIAVACALVGTVYIQIIDGAQRLTKAHLAELLSVGGPGRRAHGGAGHAVRLARVRGHGRQSALRRAGRPRAGGGPSP